ncbi:hypothetical protein ACO0OL_002120 [Hanseniaspora opuntiae]
MLKFISSVSQNVLLTKQTISTSTIKRSLFVGVPKINNSLNIYNKYNIGPEINVTYTNTINTLVENNQKLINLGINHENSPTLQLDSVWRKKTGKMTKNKLKKRRRANQILIVQKKALKKQRRANEESKENYLLANGIEFYRH